MSGEVSFWVEAEDEWLDEQVTVPMAPVADAEAATGLTEIGLAPRVAGTWIAYPTRGWTPERARRSTAVIPGEDD